MAQQDTATTIWLHMPCCHLQPPTPFVAACFPMLCPVLQPHNLGQNLAVLRGHTAPITLIAFHPHLPTALLSASSDGSLRVWDASDQHFAPLVLDPTAAAGGDAAAGAGAEAGPAGAIAGAEAATAAAAGSTAAGHDGGTVQADPEAAGDALGGDGREGAARQRRPARQAAAAAATAAAAAVADRARPGSNAGGEEVRRLLCWCNTRPDQFAWQPQLCIGGPSDICIASLPSAALSVDFLLQLSVHKWACSSYKTRRVCNMQGCCGHYLQWAHSEKRLKPASPALPVVVMNAPVCDCAAVTPGAH